MSFRVAYALPENARFGSGQIGGRRVPALIRLGSGQSRFRSIRRKAWRSDRTNDEIEHSSLTNFSPIRHREIWAFRKV